MNQLPTSISQITLSKWVEWQNMYGQKLDDRYNEIKNLTGEEKRNGYLLHQFDQYCQKYAFYKGVSIEAVMKMEMSDILPIVKEIGQNEITFKKEENALNYNAVFDWNNEQWKIQPIFPYVTKMNKQQFDDSQDVALILSDLQDGRHEALYALCATYLRHIGEPYSEALMTSRIELMKQLPLSISLCVKNYMEDSIRALLKKQ